MLFLRGKKQRKRVSKQFLRELLFSSGGRDSYVFSSFSLCKTCPRANDGMVRWANCCCSPALGSCAWIAVLFVWVLVVTMGITGAVLLPIGASQLAQFEGVVYPTTCKVADRFIKETTCSSCNGKSKKTRAIHLKFVVFL